MARSKSLMKTPKLSADNFLRAINMKLDAEAPERIQHFRPTSKSVQLLRRLVLDKNGDSAYFVVAPYGSGKSLTVTYLLHLIENREKSGDALRTIEKRLREVDPNIASWASDRRRKSQRGIVLALAGYVENIPAAVKTAAVEALLRFGEGGLAKNLLDQKCNTIQELIDFLDGIKDLALRNKWDSLILLWDEFGKHLEIIAQQGRPSILIDLQTLAEYFSRQKKLRTKLCLVLHQGLLHYAGNMGKVVRNEWIKIEGRFETIQYVDDSKELYRLVASLVDAKFDSTKPAFRIFDYLARAIRPFNIFKEFSHQELAELLEHAYPLTPFVLYLLPKVAARIAQNERTIFSFVRQCAFGSEVNTADLYNYFSDQMRADIAAGGTNRQWNETESALQKVDDEISANVLKSACMLGLGLGASRGRTPKKTLEASMMLVPTTEKKAGVGAAIRKLIDKKLLLHRKYNDDISIWHGTDIDLRGKLEEQKTKNRRHFSIVQFLEREAPSPVWKPIYYNADNDIRRYLQSYYLEPIFGLIDQSQWIKPGDDGAVLYVIPNSPGEREKALQLAKEDRNERLVFVIPKEPLRIDEAALEIHCLTKMRHDSELTASDPLIVTEINQLLDDTWRQLEKLLSALLWPSELGADWYYGGKNLNVHSESQLRFEMSKIMTCVFPETPIIHSEITIRKKLSSAGVNARKKLIMGILERAGKENLGLESSGQKTEDSSSNLPYFAMFRSIFLSTRLYYEKTQGNWVFAAPGTISSNRGLQKVWDEIRKFYTIPSDKPKEVRAFIESLINPPFGTRMGIVPILMAAGMKAFPSAMSLVKNGEYIADVRPSTIEEMCKAPELFQVRVFAIDDNAIQFLTTFYELFSSAKVRVTDSELIRRCYDSLNYWRSQLPPSASITNLLSDDTKIFRELIYLEKDPVALFLNRLPKELGLNGKERDFQLKTLQRFKQQLEGLLGYFEKRAKQSICNILKDKHEGEEGKDVRALLKQWANSFSDVFIENLKTSLGKPILLWSLKTYSCESDLLNTLSSLLVGKTLNGWDDSTPLSFERQLRSVIADINDEALKSYKENAKGKGFGEQMSVIVLKSLKENIENLILVHGLNDAEKMINTLINEIARKEITK